MRSVRVCEFEVSNDLPFIFIGGPCAIESLDHSLFMCEKIKAICDKFGIHYIFKSSFDKANRTSLSSKRGIGIEEGLRVLSCVKTEYNVPILTDIHLPDQCKLVAEVADVLQIPALLCRQTDLLEAAAKTGKVINVKKGQFVAPGDMKNVVAKLDYFGTSSIMLCDRGTCFGYNALVNDFCGLPIMAQTGYPIIFDATHSVQLPSGNGMSSGGRREFAPILARAAVAVGVAGIFMEVHDNPDVAPCDGPNMIFLRDLEQILAELVALDSVSKKFKRTI
ncbi:MAG: 3-deoxy-8-phosphooctulonate synthase [Holosporales bacterium]|jgi:2-dehydro-3-deoxyphosphooctonate aldolase (KDO 8-P synthase)|nr:3-deoxy-8-phosphooctulonate synthase [Holosporales bacterium]